MTYSMHAEFLQATQGMKIDDSAEAHDADMDAYPHETHSVSSPTKDFIIPTLNLQPPTPLLFQSPQQSNAPTSPTRTPESPIISSAPSRAISSALTKKRFVMGPREGCEKCRLKVPGHYGHID